MNHDRASHGVNIQFIGVGALQIFNLSQFGFELLDPKYTAITDSSNKVLITPRVIHNGLIISAFGTLTNEINGISISPAISIGNRLNGLSINLIWNRYQTTNGVSIAFINEAGVARGVQCGIINRTYQLNGFQFGLWNQNKQRSLPIINWNFSSMKSVQKEKD
ncbi:MAG: hypothetical protein WEC59_13760 [Salibacteraceae bacterium]